MRLVEVSVSQLTDQELDDVVAERSTTEPEYAAELRRLKAWRREHPASLLPDQRGRGYRATLTANGSSRRIQRSLPWQARSLRI